MNDLVSECKRLFIKETKKLKEPYRSWYALHAKYVGVAAHDLDKKLDPKLLQIIGWLHDIAKITRDKNHQKASAKVAVKFLKGKVKEDQLRVIIDAISNHGSAGKPRTKEGKIIQNADKLSIFYPAMKKFVLKSFGREGLKKILAKHYLDIKSKKAKQMARKLM